MKSILTRDQKKVFSKQVMVDGARGRIEVEIRYDDNCRNGHNTFTITGSLYEHPTSRADKHLLTCGCIHEEIVKYYPEFKHLIKWHFMNSDGPMHYIANTLYHSRDRTHQGKEIGEAVKWDTRLKFKKAPFTFKEQAKGFWKYLNSVGDFYNIEAKPIKYDGNNNCTYSDRYSLTGFIKDNESSKWYKAPFNSLREAEEFLEALRTYEYEFIKIPIKWCEAIEPNLTAARKSAVWEDATLKQLQNEELLKARLPKLIEDFRKDIEVLGFTF